jgi:hypothetical protein
MKQAGIAIFVIGLLITIFTGFKYVTREKVVDIGEIQISRDKTHNLAWSPLVGVAVMAVGGVVFFLSYKK